MTFAAMRICDDDSRMWTGLSILLDRVALVDCPVTATYLVCHPGSGSSVEINVMNFVRHSCVPV